MQRWLQRRKRWDTSVQQGLTRLPHSFEERDGGGVGARSRPQLARQAPCSRGHHPVRRPHAPHPHAPRPPDLGRGLWGRPAIVGSFEGVSVASLVRFLDPPRRHVGSGRRAGGGTVGSGSEPVSGRWVRAVVALVGEITPLCNEVPCVSSAGSRSSRRRLSLPSSIVAGGARGARALFSTWPLTASHLLGERGCLQVG